MHDVSVSLDLPMEAERAFDMLVDELRLALESHGMNLDARAGGAITEASAKVGSIQEWSPGERISFVWQSKSWEVREGTKVVIKFEEHDGGTRVAIEIRDWGRVIGEDGGELLGWFAGEVVAPLLSAIAPNR